MTYSQSFPYYITHDEVCELLTDHHLLHDIGEFYIEHGVHAKYKSKDVLSWLGY